MFPVECVVIVQPVSVLWQLQSDKSHIPAGPEYTRGVQLVRDQRIWMASLECRHDWLERVPCHIAVIGRILSGWK